jgi:hypothetical protein
LSTPADVFNCVISQFKTAALPVQLGPVPEPDYPNTPALNDSIFIAHCLHDTSYYEEPVENRTYSYYKSRIIDKNDRYVICLMLFGFNVGFSYQLYSFTPTGEFIDKKEIGAQASDWYETYGFINDKKTFEIFKNEFDYYNNRWVIKTKTHEKYIITDDGKFRKQPK